MFSVSVYTKIDEWWQNCDYAENLAFGLWASFSFSEPSHKHHHTQPPLWESECAQVMCVHFSFPGLDGWQRNWAAKMERGKAHNWYLSADGNWTGGIEYLGISLSYGTLLRKCIICILMLFQARSTRFQILFMHRMKALYSLWLQIRFHYLIGRTWVFKIHSGLSYMVLLKLCVFQEYEFGFIKALSTKQIS